MKVAEVFNLSGSAKQRKGVEQVAGCKVDEGHVWLQKEGKTNLETFFRVKRDGDEYFRQIHFPLPSARPLPGHVLHQALCTQILAKFNEPDSTTVNRILSEADAVQIEDDMDVFSLQPNAPLRVQLQRTKGALPKKND